MGVGPVGQICCREGSQAWSWVQASIPQGRGPRVLKVELGCRDGLKKLRSLRAGKDPLEMVRFWGCFGKLVCATAWAEGPLVSKQEISVPQIPTQGLPAHGEELLGPEGLSTVC